MQGTSINTLLTVAVILLVILWVWNQVISPWLTRRLYEALYSPEEREYFEEHIEACIEERRNARFDK